MATKTIKISALPLKGGVATFSDSQCELRSLAKAIADKDGHGNASLAVRQAVVAAATDRNLEFILT